MADHASQQIREAIVTLVTGLQTTGANVYDTRVYDYDVVPCLSVYDVEWKRDETYETFGDRIRQIEHFIVEARVKPLVGEATPEDMLATIRKEVQVVLNADPTLAGKCRWFEIISSKSQYTGELERPAGMVEMICVAHYDTKASDPTVILP